MFGPHLTLDCYECEKGNLKSEKFILDFLKEMVGLLGMHIVKGPFVVLCEESSEAWDNGGISAVVVIAESHISIHTFPDNDGFACLDLFSCKDFDVEKAIGFIREQLKPKEIDKNLFNRGKHFPKEKYLVSKIVREQRSDVSLP